MALLWHGSHAYVCALRFPPPSLAAAVAATQPTAGIASPPPMCRLNAVLPSSPPVADAKGAVPLLLDHQVVEDAMRVDSEEEEMCAALLDRTKTPSLKRFSSALQRCVAAHNQATADHDSEERVMQRHLKKALRRCRKKGSASYVFCPQLC